ncbi:MAG TPA: sulfite exporter TauE/SafE family protein [Vicinamibacterales bacterium]|nr:sulfite exporter TauE/SafE family protein [Vicinamibacterales bacterium]
MVDPLHLVLLFGVGAVAGFFNVFAGGGSSIVLPTLIFMGLDATLANGTNRVAIALQTLAAVLSFHNEGHSEVRRSFTLAAWTLPGAVAGALVALRVTDALFERILGVVMIGIVLSMFASPAGRQGGSGRTRSRWIYPAMFALGFYGGFIQVGIGFMLMAALFHLEGASLVRVNMHKVFIVMIYTLPAVAVFAWSGQVDWLIGIVLGAGNALGAWWGARLAVRRGDRFIRLALIAAIVLMAMKLFGLY